MMRPIATATKKPTPMPMMQTSAIGAMTGATPVTCAASTCTSGSATVMMKPTVKPTASMSARLRFAVSAEPTFWPTGRTPMSAPTRKRPRPITKSAAPARKRGRASPSGATVKWSRSTRKTTGTAEITDSLHFSRKSIPVLC